MNIHKYTGTQTPLERIKILGHAIDLKTTGHSYKLDYLDLDGEWKEYKQGYIIHPILDIRISSIDNKSIPLPPEAVTEPRDVDFDIPPLDSLVCLQPMSNPDGNSK